MSQQYRVPRWCAIVLLSLLALAISGCGSVSVPGITTSGDPTATPRPWARFRVEEITDALTAVGLPLQNLESNTSGGRGGMPLTFGERYTFEIPRVAPGGGQIMTFRTPEDLQTFTDWVTDMRNDPEQRRTVVYVYTNQNAVMQLNADLTNQEAAAYRDTFLALQ